MHDCKSFINRFVQTVARARVCLDIQENHVGLVCT